MSEAQEWRQCPYCRMQKFSSPGLFADHMRDCNQRPAAVPKPLCCPRHGTLLVRKELPDYVEFKCEGECVFEIDVINGNRNDIR